MTTVRPASPAFAGSPIQAYVDQLLKRFTGLTGGQVATYIPELAKADPADFGIVLATADGRLYEAGTTRRTFSIQSISKALVYGIALEDHGRVGVEAKVGVEPTGDAFNSISLESGTGRPLNPMVNAGAIATTGMVRGLNGEDSHAARLARIVDTISAYAGRPLMVDEAVAESERATGHRNRAIGHLLRNAGILEGDPEPVLDLYFRQCAVLVDARDLALVAATLANRGVNPVTGRRAVAADAVDAVLSLMTTCGMYDFAGEWVYRVGLPAKSGVGGGIIAVLPGQIGIGVYSPALDARGNSVRGVAVCETLSSELGLHFLLPPKPAGSAVRARYTLAQVRSKRKRTGEELKLLDAHGARVAVYELQGDLRFAALEPVLRDIIDAGDALRTAVLDFHRVTHADVAAARMLARLAVTCAARGQHLLLSRVRRGELLAEFDAALAPHAVRAVSFQPQLDLALESCERHLLATLGVAQRRPAGPLSLAEHRLCAGLTAADLDALQTCMTHQVHDAGTTIVGRGDPADALYFLVAGEVSVVVSLPQGGHRRLATLAAGLGFGEAALIDGGLRSADVRADTEVGCWVLGATAFHRLCAERPALAAALMGNLLRAQAETIARLTVEVAALEG